jgi:hypothetical protein
VLNKNEDENLKRWIKVGFATFSFPKQSIALVLFIQEASLWKCHHYDAELISLYVTNLWS